ncbi:unnamed protein product [Paramecium sonneborni]|uniref:Uncharacterized protein n=1 Tax=Paramecium sonneborni TaxID=65129 RepID=A0A8S1QZ24_9CILI|nr:unnamed protein product [Paramecium sonneborni]
MYIQYQLIKFQKHRRQSNGFQNFISFYQSRGAPKNQVLYDGDKKNSIRTYNDNVNNRQGFKIGWDIDQSRKGDTKIAGKVGQDQRNSYIPSYQTQTYVPVVEQTQDDDYMKQLYYQEMNKKQELAALYKQPEPYYQDALDNYNNGKQNPNNNYSNAYEQPQMLQQSNKYDHYQQPNDDEELYQKYKQGNSGNKQQNIGKPPLAQYNPITGAAYENAYTQQRAYEPQQQQQQQQDDALSQFSQLQQHKVTSMKNKSSNIFNTDLQETENINNNRQNSRGSNKRKELDDAQYKGYGQFYKNPIEPVQNQYREQKFVNRNMIDNHIFPK